VRRYALTSFAEIILVVTADVDRPDVGAPALRVVVGRIADLVVREHEHLLFTWNPDSEACSWLCAAPSPSPRDDIYPPHAVLLRSFGGIIERANEPDGTWLLNQNEVLTEHEASHDGSFIQDYAWAFDDAGGIPIALPEYYSIAREANGNDTLCHRREGTILLFAPDHAFEHITPLPSCPEYTLYTIDGAHRFADWVNTIARQWITAMATTPRGHEPDSRAG
jgi:hypothetical protein